jgi:hypothetical protein
MCSEKWAGFQDKPGCKLCFEDRTRKPGRGAILRAAVILVNLFHVARMTSFHWPAIKQFANHIRI